MEMLAEVTWENIVMMGSAMGVLTGIQALREKRRNGKSFSRSLCDEKHKNIDNKLDHIRENQINSEAKLDKLINHFL